MSGTLSLKSKTIRLTVYSHAQVQPCLRGRWRELAANHPVSVHLVVPSCWESTWFGEPIAWTPSAVEEKRFRVTPVPVTSRRHWGRYAFRTINGTLRQQPADAIIVYGEEFSLLLHQIIWCRRRFARQAKLAFFTWNNLTILGGRRLWLKRWLWKRVCRGTDAAMAGNEKGARLIRDAGYPGQVLMQTEIGVDENHFHPDSAIRGRVRQKIGAQGFVFGFAGRLTAAKGLDDLFTALENVRSERTWTLLLVGDGDLRDELERRVDRLAGRVVFVGQRPAAEMPDWLRAMDCLVLPSRSMPDWEEQFGLVIPQAALCGALVVGSDSGAIPEVLGTMDAVFRERSPAQLAELLSRAIEDHDWRETLTGKVRTAARQRHTTTALAAQTYGWISDDLLSAPRRQ